LELHLTSPTNTRDVRYRATGVVRILTPDPQSSKLPLTLEGSSVRIRSLVTGMTEEAFLDEQGTFVQDLELEPETDNVLELAVCDGVGEEVARAQVCVRHQTEAPPLEQARLLTGPLPTGVLDPPWTHFAQLIRHCLDLAAEVANHTGRDRDELFVYVYGQERYAEQAQEERNQALYRECHDNLAQYADYLTRLLGDNLPGGGRPTRPPEEEAREEVERFRILLAAVWKQVRARERQDLEPRLTEIAGQARGFSQRIKTDAHALLRDARRLVTEVEKIEERLQGSRPRGPTGGLSTPGEEDSLLEGTA
jgi:hypothetical protein